MWELFKGQHRLLTGLAIQLSTQYPGSCYCGNSHPVTDKQYDVLCTVPGVRDQQPVVDPRLGEALPVHGICDHEVESIPKKKVVYDLGPYPAI